MNDDQILSTADAAKRLGITARRVQQLVKSGQLPAGVFGGSLTIRAKDLKLVAGRPGAGRPKKAKKGTKK